MGAGALFAVTTLIRTFSVGKPWRSWVPGGIAVAVGTLASVGNLVPELTQPRHVQRSVVHVGTCYRGYLWLALGACHETVQYTLDYSCIGK